MRWDVHSNRRNDNPLRFSVTWEEPGNGKFNDSPEIAKNVTVKVTQSGMRQSMWRGNSKRAITSAIGKILELYVTSSPRPSSPVLN